MWDEAGSLGLQEDYDEWAHWAWDQHRKREVADEQAREIREARHQPAHSECGQNRKAQAAADRGMPVELVQDAAVRAAAAGTREPEGGVGPTSTASPACVK